MATNKHLSFFLLISSLLSLHFGITTADSDGRPTSHISTTAFAEQWLFVDSLDYLQSGKGIAEQTCEQNWLPIFSGFDFNFNPHLCRLSDYQSIQLTALQQQQLTSQSIKSALFQRITPHQIISANSDQLPKN